MRKPLVHKIGIKCHKQIRNESTVDSEVTCPYCLSQIQIPKDPLKSDIMWARTPMELSEIKDGSGLLSTIFHNSGTVIDYNSASFNLENFADLMHDIELREKERRDMLDKEYTPMEEIKLEELEAEIAKYGDSVPNGLFIKVRWAGRYFDMPALALLRLQRNIKSMIDKKKPPRNIYATF